MDTSSPHNAIYVESICCLDDDSTDKASELAAFLDLLLAPHVPTTSQLLVSANHISLQVPQLGKPIIIDFEAGKNDHRRKFGGGRGQPLAKAIGLKKGFTPSVIDATAGFARDAFVLATLGCDIMLVEQNPILYLLIKDALEHAGMNESVSSITDKMQLTHMDSVDFLRTLSPASAPDVIYMDPMYPSRDKSALVKKEMQLLHQMIGPDTQSADLLCIARQTANKRVVVKRPKGAEFIADQKPTVSIESKNTRYDVYVKT